MAHHFKTGASIPAQKQPHVKIGDLMARRVVTTLAHQTVGHVKQILQKHRFQAIPVIDSDSLPAGIVTTTDLLAAASETTRISDVMTRKVFSVPEYEDPAMAARIMRNHKIHHLIITHEKKVVGIVSTFDLLKLIEGKRFTAKVAPTRSQSRGQRKRSEDPDQASDGPDDGS